MRALVVYESMYGNTHRVAINVAAGLRATHEVADPALSTILGQRTVFEAVA